MFRVCANGLSDADKAADCAGAGKTSVINTIFRLMELDQGGIYIDDVEVAKLGLAQLRNSMAIIPQVGSLPVPPLLPFSFVDAGKLQSMSSAFQTSWLSAETKCIA